MTQRSDNCRRVVCTSLLAILMQVGFPLRAQSVEKDPSATVTLEIVPTLCVLEASEQFCQDTINLQWQSVQKQSLCLYQLPEKDAVLKCWRQQDQGQFEMAVITPDSIRFELRDSNDQRLLASTELQVTREQQRLRQRRRNPWNFF